MSAIFAELIGSEFDAMVAQFDDADNSQHSSPISTRKRGFKSIGLSTSRRLEFMPSRIAMAKRIAKSKSLSLLISSHRRACQMPS